RSRTRPNPPSRQSRRSTVSTQFEGQIAIVTGAAAGIGNAIATHLAERGARIVGVDISETLTEALEALPGTGHLALPADISDQAAAADAVQRAERELGVPQILVNSAGVGLFRSGAAAGIGNAIATHLAERGARIVGVDISETLTEALEALPGTGHLALPADISDQAAAADAVQRAERELGVPQILVNSAGVGLF